MSDEEKQDSVPEDAPAPYKSQSQEQSQEQPKSPPQPSPVTGRPDEVPRVDFDELSQGDNSVLIRFGEITYTLRKTSAGKLVLNK